MAAEKSLAETGYCVDGDGEPGAGIEVEAMEKDKTYDQDFMAVSLSGGAGNQYAGRGNYSAHDRQRR
jgi:hypothetical protein